MHRELAPHKFMPMPGGYINRSSGQQETRRAVRGALL